MYLSVALSGINVNQTAKTPLQFNAICHIFKDDVLWKEAGCTTELDYTEQTSWLLFLKCLDDMEQDKKAESELEGKRYSFILDKDYHWDSWAAPKGKDGKIDHNKAWCDPRYQ